MKFGWKHYFEPTPKLIRKFADSLLVMSMGLSTATYLSDNQKLGFIILIVANFCKFLSNFFKDDA